MKKLFFLLMMLAAWGSSYAQDREIKMPESPKKSYNIANAGSGYWCAIEFGGGSTLMENKKNVALVGASYTGGLRLNEYLKVGVGLGVLYYPNSSNVRSTRNHLAMPLFVNLRGDMLADESRTTVPYWSVNIGTTLPDGLFLTPTVGLRIGEKRNAVLIGISYTLRHLNTYPYATNHSYSGALLKLGYEF